MTGCCSHFECSASQQFNQKKVTQELKRYRAKGPGPTTRLLVEGITESDALGGTVLDVGSGIGSLTLALLEHGSSSAVAVDASAAYVGAARDEADRRGRAEAIRFVHADFVLAASELPSASIVTLDRVVCCYEFCETLLDAAAAHAERCLALSYPRDVWYVRVGTALENGQRRLTRNSFRTFVHPAPLIEDSIARAGFKLSSRRESWVWSADVYLRK
jgi:magnesium-protoporphyrin O-methyltransferase